MATKPLPDGEGLPCEECKRQQCFRKGGQRSCLKYGLGFDSLEGELRAFWDGPWGRAIRREVGMGHLKIEGLGGEGEALHV